jgi:3-isopropylmalate/(R)-2-methylmalate dehydratase small subunit
MATFTTITSHAVVLDADDVDTDQIIPARFLKTLRRDGLGAKLFADWRYDASGAPRAEFTLNRPGAAGAQILVAGVNFGCGSSREHAPWALAGWGIRVVIARSFADIFEANALKNGVLPVALDAESHARVRAFAADGGARITVDLATQSVRTPDGRASSFAIDPFAKHCLLEGIDELDYLLTFQARIEDHEARQPR